MGLFDAIMAPLVAQQQYTNDKALYQQQRLDSIDFTNQMLEYNKPVNQIERLKEAGVNPSTLAMNGGSVVSGAGNQPAPAQLPTPVSHDYGQVVSSMLSSLANSRLMGAQTKTEDLLREEKYNNLKLENEQYVANIEKIGVDAKAVQIANEYAAALNEVSLMKSRSEIGLNFHQMAIARKELEKMKYVLENVLPQEVKESVSRTNLNLLEQDKVVAEIERIFYENAKTQAETAESGARKELLDVQTETEKAQQGFIEQETDIAEKENKYLDKQVQLFLDTYDEQVEQIATDLKISKKQAQWFVAQQLIGAATQLSFTAASGALVGKSFKRPVKVGF